MAVSIPAPEGEACEVVAYFGYGSLVNRLTHRTEIVAAYRARLHGWRRFWRPRPDMPFDTGKATPVSLLTVTRHPGALTDGLLVIDRAENLPDVDLREMHYARRALRSDEIMLLDGNVPEGCPLYVYEAHEAVPEHDGPCPIHQSYLDAVLQGFLAEHGETGLRDFIFSTGGFEIPVLADRAAPIYPRAVRLDPVEEAHIDALLAERGIHYLPL